MNHHNNQTKMLENGLCQNVCYNKAKMKKKNQ